VNATVCETPPIVRVSSAFDVTVVVDVHVVEQEQSVLPHSQLPQSALQ
jgi:hypothetical protein